MIRQRFDYNASRALALALSLSRSRLVWVTSQSHFIAHSRGDRTLRHADGRSVGIYRSCHAVPHRRRIVFFRPIITISGVPLLLPLEASDSAVGPYVYMGVHLQARSSAVPSENLVRSIVAEHSAGIRRSPNTIISQAELDVPRSKDCSAPPMHNIVRDLMSTDLHCSPSAFSHCVKAVNSDLHVVGFDWTMLSI